MLKYANYALSNSIGTNFHTFPEQVKAGTKFLFHVVALLESTETTVIKTFF